MNQNPLRYLMREAVWLVLVGGATFAVWTSAAHAVPGAKERGQPIPGVNADSGTSTAGQGSIGPAESMPMTAIDPNSFPTPSPEEIATREAMLGDTYLPGPAQPPADQEVAGPVPNTETNPSGDLGSTAQSLIEKAPLPTSLATVGSAAVLFMLAKFLRALAFLLRGK